MRRQPGDGRVGAQIIDRLFGRPKPLIGDIHLLPLPGTPRHAGESMATIVDRALADAEAYLGGGMDGVIVENHGDIPFLPPDEIGPEIIAAMAVVTRAIVERFAAPVGVNLLANGAVGGLAIAKAAGGRFIRVNQ